MKLISLLLIIFIFSTNISFAKDKDFSYTDYQKNIEDICKAQYLTKDKIKKIFIKKETKYKEVKKIFLGNDYPRADKVISSANGIYAETMNSIYRCAIINTQIIAMKNFKKNLINKYDKVGDIKKKLIQKLDSKINQVKQKSTYKIPDGTFDGNGNPNLISKNACTSARIKETYHKKHVLNNATYETCKYLYYMDYLKEYYKDIDKVITSTVNESKKNNMEKRNKIYSFLGLDYQETGTGYTLSPGGIASAQNYINTKIENSRKHAKEVFTMSFVAYTEYENNFPIHLLLQIIREDFIVFRKKLHEVLNPINQVVYKIVNCQNL